MTRDEAAKIIREVNQLDGPGEAYPDARQKWSEMMVDTLAALGLLTLDEPKDGHGFHRLVTAMGYHPQGSVAEDIKNALWSANLKIVEK